MDFCSLRRTGQVVIHKWCQIVPAASSKSYATAEGKFLNLNENTMFFIQANAYENSAYKMLAIFIRPQCVDSSHNAA